MVTAPTSLFSNTMTGATIAHELPFELDVKRSRRRTAVIYVRNGRAEVRVPTHTPDAWVKAFVTERSEWIMQQLQAAEIRQREAYCLDDGSTITYLGEALTIRQQAADSNTVELHGDELWLPADDLFTDRKRLFHCWLKARAEQHITPLVEQLVAQLQTEERLSAVRYRKTKSRWGHCTRTGIVQFNWLIMMAPPDVVHYLVSHEVCHLIHLNHSKHYWALVDSVCANRKASQKWLRANEHKLLALH